MPRSGCRRTRRARRKGETRASPVTCAPDLEQLMQERREAIQSAVAISTSPLASESDPELHNRQVTDLLLRTTCRN
ncbi:hypothetical protein NDU88_007007 [Pleurodeles waltl]|uniref:Uncharacterized protein n=1 Tax=Pleurodeles waltl TaxID=8319 RepID=A0AAV7RQL0_PLEWA|nr:hypothetical protein NDU88_007007 [Pleurodeles waltl]